MSYTELYFMGKIYGGLLGLLLLVLFLLAYFSIWLYDWWEGRAYRKLKKEAKRVNRN